jgi:hypothetical protein
MAAAVQSRLAVRADGAGLGALQPAARNPQGPLGGARHTKRRRHARRPDRREGHQGLEPIANFRGGSVAPSAIVACGNRCKVAPLPSIARRASQGRGVAVLCDRVHQRAAREVQPPAPPAPQPAPLPKDPGRSIPGHPPADRLAATVSPGKSELGRRRYDWTPAPTGIDAIVRGPRGPSGGRER